VAALYAGAAGPDGARPVVDADAGRVVSAVELAGDELLDGPDFAVDAS
jgi:hypothetical protein